jgi:hypothetical protein
VILSLGALRGDHQLTFLLQRSFRGSIHSHHPRNHVHFTPSGGSWLNLVERLSADVTQRCVRRGSLTNVAQLERSMLTYLEHRNRDPKPFVWTAKADLVLGKVEGLCERISNSGH